MADVEALGHRHPEARRLRELLRDPAMRRSERRFVLEGPRLVGDAVARGFPLEVVYLGPGAPRAFADLVGTVTATGCPVRELKEGVLEKVGSTKTPQPVLAVAAMPTGTAVGEITPGVVVITVGMQDPGNLGTIVRSAEAAGATAVIAAGGVDPWNPKVVRGSAGSVLGLPVLPTDDPVAVLGELRARGARVAVADGSAPAEYTDADLSGFVVVVVGSEAHGVPAEIDAVADVRVRITMSGAAESLNAGVAASILLFEAARQTRG